MQTQNRLKIALQKKGRLSQDCAALLKQCGVKINWNEQRLIAYSENLPIEILRVRDDDIPGLIFDGVVDLGIIGENVLEEEELGRLAAGETIAYKKLRQLDFGGCRLSLAIDRDQTYNGVQPLLINVSPLPIRTFYAAICNNKAFLLKTVCSMAR